MDFRPKGYGWNSRLKICFDNGEIYLGDQEHDWYLYNYFHNFSLRKSCYHCAYGGNNHQSDITLGDFWRIEQYNKEYAKEPGVGLVLCNTQKGKKILEEIKPKHLEKICSEFFSYVFNDGHSWYSRSGREKLFSEISEYGVLKLENRLKQRLAPYDFVRKIKRKIQLLTNR